MGTSSSYDGNRSVADHRKRESAHRQLGGCESVDEPIERTIEIDALPEEVWAALIDPVSLSEWVGAAAELEPEPGGAARFRFPDGTRRLGLVEEWEPPRRLAIRWREIRGVGFSLDVRDASVVVFELTPRGDRTIVTVSETPGLLVPESEALAR
jgi:uncharacterized protein YndB with AHSA1/START domain